MRCRRLEIAARPEETLHKFQSSDTGSSFRFPVQLVVRAGQDFRGLAGTVTTGKIAQGAEVVDAVSGRRARVKRIVTMGRDLEVAGAGQAVVLQLDTDIDVSRGAVLAAPGAVPPAVRGFEARLVWLADAPFDSGRGYLSRVFDEGWMANFGFLKECDECVCAILGHRGRTPELLYVNPSQTVRNTIDLMRGHEVSHLPVCKNTPPFANAEVSGAVDELELMDAIYRNPKVLDMEVENIMGPKLPTIFASHGVEPTAVRLFPVSVARLGPPPPEIWDGRRTIARAALNRVTDPALQRLGAEYLDALDRYAVEAAEAGTSFVEIQNTMLFATVGQKISS